MATLQRSPLTPPMGIVRTYDAIGIGIERTHAVQYYEDDAFLVASVGDYLASGLALGQPVLAVATPEHRAGIRAHLEARGFDADRASLRGQLTLADAGELLATFMEGTLPDPQRCRASVGALLEAHSRGHGTTVRVFGEMVDVLCRAGNVEGALRLEDLWNELALTHRFSLLCGYSMRTFSNCSHSVSVASISHAHAHVIPTEAYTSVTESARASEIAMLQQRALALEFEMARREALETSLREALKRAESANRAKNQFLAVMSHELRTPLNAIGGHVQLVEMELLGAINEKQRDALARVQRSQRHLLGLINDVLNLARLESSQVIYTSGPFELEDLLAEVISLLDPLFHSNGLTCTTEAALPGDSFIVRGDREKVHQILLNLFGNAIKFTPSGGRICVGASLGSDPSTVHIAVTDTGIGMPMEKLDAIFEPFVQLSGGAPGQNDGVGLGLSISRTLARGMGGDLTVRSTDGQGSTFILKLPSA